MMRLKYLYTVFLLVLLPACDQSDPAESDARITEEGVDGVRFGDTPEEVLEKLGPYDAFANTDGVRAWQTYYYEEGFHKGLKIYFMEVDSVDENGHETVLPGPVDLFTVFGDYSGKTAEGIGIGSRQEEVRQAYGAPVKRSRTGKTHFYCFGERNMEIVILADTVASIHMGYFEPLEEGTLISCTY